VPFHLAVQKSSTIHRSQWLHSWPLRRLLRLSAAPFVGKSTPGEVPIVEAGLVCFRRESRDSLQVLLQQIERRRKEDDSFIRKSARTVIAGNRRPMRQRTRHEWDNCYRQHERKRSRPSAKDAEFLVPESKEQKRAKEPFRHSQEITGTPDSEDGYIQEMSGRLLIYGISTCAS